MATVTEHGIEDLLAQALKAALTKWCITNVSDDSKADHVVLGKPTRELRDEIVVSIHMQHPLGPGADKDSYVSGPPRSQSDRSWTWPAEIGGGRMEKIVGAIQIRIRDRESYDEAIAIISAIVERVKACVNRDPDLVPLTDDFGTTLQILETFQAQGHTGGGGDMTVSYRWIDWRAFVHRRDCRT